MAYSITNTTLGYQPIAGIDTVQNHPLGTRVQAKDPTYGVGEFIYLAGVASTVTGSWVTFDQDGNTTALLAANAIGPVAVAMGANVASSYGWYQIYGKAVGLALVGSGICEVYLIAWSAALVYVGVAAIPCTYVLVTVLIFGALKV